MEKKGKERKGKGRERREERIILPAVLVPLTDSAPYKYLPVRLLTSPALSYLVIKFGEFALEFKRPPGKKFLGTTREFGNELTYELYDFLSVNSRSADGDKPDVYVLGIDLDPILVERSREGNPRPDRVTFEHLEFLSSERDPTISRYLEELGRCRFDAVFCFSVSMWIHLNHGDDGLVEFFRKACSICDTIVVEPQPWKCYRNASRRLRLANLEDFPLIKKLERRGDTSDQIERILTDLCDFRKVVVTNGNDWERKIMIFARNRDRSSVTTM
ncbi:putative RNA methyltransferase CG11342 [Vespula maculifrons]|uniref:RNA methyltransferase n=1 Tax=Vespula maculifrons TaxID=7453 RepID=A0ABD2BFR8_VESMC